MMYDDRGWGWGWWMMGGGLLLLLLVVVAAVVAVVLASRGADDRRVANPGASHAPAAPGSLPPHPSEDALRELDLRFARGEVDEDAYLRTRELLYRTPGR